MTIHPTVSGIAASLTTLAAHPLRTALSTLGIMLGVASLVAVLSVGDGMERFARTELARGTDLHALTITPRTTKTVDGLVFPISGYPVFGWDDMGSLKAAVPDLASVALLVSGPGMVESPRLARPRAAMVMGSLGAPGRRLAAGRHFTSEEMAGHATVAVVSHNLASALGGTDSVLHSEVTIGGQGMTVVGIMVPSPDRLFLVDVPAALVPRITDTTSPAFRPPSLVAVVDRLESASRARQGVEAWLATRVPGWEQSVSIEQNEHRLRQATQAMALFKLFMGSIVGVSLLVGGLGVMNVLLASVTERTREIGIRRASGARRRDVLWQFLAESLVVTSLGSGIGLGAGFGSAVAVTAVMRAKTETQIGAVLQWPTVLVALVAAVITGLVFGVYPALRASRISPIEAMRHE